LSGAVLRLKKEARQGDEGHEDNQYQDGRSTERGR
jgi:hypothetical protein